MSKLVKPTCELRIASGNEDSAAVYIRQRRLEIGQPLSFDAKYSGITALEAFSGAFAADIINGLLLRARKRRIQIDQVEALVKLWLRNPLTFLDVVGEEGDPSIESLLLQLYVSTLEMETLVKALLDETLVHSPLFLTLRKAANVKVNFQIAF
jgi:hypothetical protein